ncbi:glutamine--tRNA ligase/YqeY domain fusion protein [Maribacter flavus]|uniref:Glutamine--tRNA ligase n=1 Tax=Maribacter flavus TaxID=1658664 RepID=A0A5B2TRT8_9FLAO|nr:glutamine--tRNA ligase/YqeY domain fusion protein [Maribacter flavus]KAA2217381.1 glutamine--tRNA ligase/YqeY domain fusion protein [Maribacter flavus]
MANSTNQKTSNFLEEQVVHDLDTGLKVDSLKFRFPPEPNGYLHIGHAASLFLNFGLALKYNAPIYLRFDDTNPTQEEQKFVDAIKEDIKWLGFKWSEERYTSDYFQQLYDWAILLIKKGKAYVDDQTSEEIAEQKGTPTNMGKNSPYRNRTPEENFDLFQRMKLGEFLEGARVLRAKIDMASPNMLMRDPIMYRIVNKAHHRTGNDWHIYPMYDWAHGQSDFIEGISHSLCTLEFGSHRELYDWFINQINIEKELVPHQFEFARRNLSYTVLSKRKLGELVEKGLVSGWDDPRMPTIAGLRRRGYTPNSIKSFSEKAGISKRDNVSDIALLEHSIREELNATAQRVMVVVNPIKLTITNYDKEKEILEIENNPENPQSGFRKVTFSKELIIEQEDFKEHANRKFFRLTLGKEVRLKGAYIIKANEVVKDSKGKITEIKCTYDPKSKSGSNTEESKRKVKGTLHWVSMKHSVGIEVRNYDRLFNDPMPEGHEGKDFMEFLNPTSLTVNKKALAESSVEKAEIGDRYQFQRLGYYRVDENSNASNLVFNKTVSLKSSFNPKNTL